MLENPEEHATGVDDVSPLRSLIVEIHEIYQELIDVGFSSSVAAQIVGHMLSVAVGSRGDDDDDEDEVEDEPEV